MKKIIDWIIEQRLESLDDYPKLVNPMTEEFTLSLDKAENIINTVVEWECDSNTIYSLEEVLNEKFPEIVI
jgi:hypothetical protein